MRALLASLLVLAALPAQAWESVCFQYPDPTLAPAAYAGVQAPPCSPSYGANTARQRWVGLLDEHRALFELTRNLAGLPEAISGAWALRVFSSSAQVPLGTGQVPSLQPVAFDQATRAHTRVLSVGELAQLPDFSYALWDWASGHETCPLDGAGVEPAECHDFASHMGPVNSNHFVPQAGAFYARYHALALERAAQCKQLGQRLASAGGRFDDVGRACELEALALESVGQHFLHDAWSMGHTWQRWGSPNLSDFPGAGDDRRDRAVLVALTAGLVHGARGVLQKLPAWTSYDVDDALCAPNDAVRMLAGDGAQLGAVGDDYLTTLPRSGGDATYADQEQRIFSCAASGLLQVYRASGELHGAAVPQAVGLQSVDPTGPGCFAQRATNVSMLTAMGVQLKLAGQQLNLKLDSRAVGMLVPHVARSQGTVPVDPSLRNQFRHQLQRVVSMTRLWAARNPGGTEVAEGSLGSFLGVPPNGTHTGLASYVDPQLPWPDTPEPGGAGRALALALTFHRAHAADWCASFDSTALASLRSHAQDSSLDAEAHAAACEVCAELVARHLRVGADAQSYDAAREPLCYYAAVQPAFVYQPAAGSAGVPELAAAWCGCP